MIPVYTDDGQFAKCKANVIHQYMENGCIVTEYLVLVPDHTISGDYRHEFAVTRAKVEP